MFPRLLCVGPLLQRLQRLFERSHGFPMRRPRLSLGRGLPLIGHSFVPHPAAPVVVGEDLDDVVGPALVEQLQAAAGRGMEAPPSALEEARVHDFLRQRMLEAVHQLRILRTRKDEVAGMEVLEVARHLIVLGLTDVGHQRDAEAAADD